MGLDDFDQSTEASNDDGYNHVYPKDEKYKDRGWLETKITDEGRSQADVANICGVSRSTIQYYKEKYDIKTAEENQDDKRVDLSDYQVDVIEGELLGDGSLHKPGGYGNAKFQTTDMHVEHLEFLYNVLPDSMFTDNYIFSGQHGASNLVSRNVVELTEIHNKWYNSDKVVPEDFKMNSTNLLHLYMGDGTLPDSSGPRIDMNWGDKQTAYRLRDMISNCVGPCSVLDYMMYDRPFMRISIPKDIEDEFFEYIGEPPTECYAYKWR